MPKPTADLVQTKSAQKWLRQFPKEDLPTARFLLTNLRFVSHTTLERGLKSLVKHHSQRGTPIALYAVRQLASNEAYFPGIGLGPTLRIRQTARPSRTVPGDEVGSEGRVANIIRDLAKKHPTIYFDHPSPAELREHRCSQILLLDDVLATSGRLKRFLRHLRLYRWLKSWQSFKWVKLVASVYCASEDGEVALRKEFAGFLSDITYQARPRFGVDWWSYDQRKAVERLCEKTAQRANINLHRLGRREGLGTLFFESGCTSISPPILWEKTDIWEPLFPDRKLPDDILDILTSSSPKRKFVLIPIDAPIPSPATASKEITKWSAGDEQMLMILRAASKRLRSIEQIAAWTGLEVTKCTDLDKRCKLAAFLDQKGFLTELGKAELRRLRAQAAKVREQRLKGPTDSFYYPTRLRSARSPTSGTTKSSGPDGVPKGSVGTNAKTQL